MDADREAANTTSGVSALALSIGAAIASFVCVLAIAVAGLLSYEKGTDWSVSLLGLLLRYGVWLSAFAVIGWLAIAAMTAPRRTNSAVAIVTSTTLAGLSLLFAVTAAFWTVAGAFRSATHPNRHIYSLYSAACKADMESVKRELARGVSATTRWTNISPGDGGDAVAAYFMCYKNGQPFDQDLVETLLAAGSSLTSRSESYGTPLEAVLINAPQEDRVRAATYLVSKGLSPNGSYGPPGRPLAISAGRGDLETVKVLLALGATTGAPNLASGLFTADRRFCGEVAQDAAPFDMQAHLAVVDLLVEHGLKITPESLAGGRAFCGRKENRMVTLVESRLNRNAGQ